MPIYEYSCPSCHQKFELLRPLSKASEKAECPRCHQQAERTISLFSSMAKDASGVTSTIGGSACGSCSPSSSSCGTCGP